MERQEYKIVLKKIGIVLTSTTFCNDIKRATYPKWIDKLFNFCIIGEGSPLYVTQKRNRTATFFFIIIQIINKIFLIHLISNLTS